MPNRITVPIGVRLQLDVPWTPENVSTFAWYDAGDASTVTESGGNVSQWDDKSGNARNLIQLSGGNQPQWGVGAQINGINVMHYSGTFDQMSSNFADVDLTQFAMVALIEAKTSGDWPSLGYVRSADLSDYLNGAGTCGATSGRLNSSIRIDGVTSSLQTANVPELAEEIPFIGTYWYDGSSAVARTNGGAQSTSVDVADGATFSIGRTQVGRQVNTPRNWQGELIILPISDIATIEKAEGYLAHKWGTVGNLDNSHPYKNIRPMV